ncbi:hypothetical protein K469DRAFT_694995 [Zopfia rhizophila CBS 207.26]|uniref:Uncharacterized protein n=1 Tax=Zopfia rhizophila CBS 207.26 TaxID=1314779 RepID=A0A6A6DKY1_9PEZI|nr:hypothetical protein K469DRAFT_694995 [Zopfia rhizophila CBS 207.26]
MRSTAIGDLDSILYFIQRAHDENTLKNMDFPYPDWAAHWDEVGRGGGLYNAILFVTAQYGQQTLSLWALRGVLPRSRRLLSPLEVAAKKGYWGIVRFLLEEGAEANSKVLGGVAKSGWIKVVQLLVDEGVAVWPCSCGFGGNAEAFEEFVKRGHIDLVRFSLENGFDVDK